MRWSLLLALSLGASAGCDRSERKRQTAVEEFETLSRDLCLRNWLSDAQRTRITEGFRSGRLPPDRVDATLAAFLALVLGLAASGPDDGGAAVDLGIATLLAGLAR